MKTMHLALAEVKKPKKAKSFEDDFDRPDRGPDNGHGPMKGPKSNGNFHSKGHGKGH